MCIFKQLSRIALVFIFVYSGIVFAQKDPIKYGKINIEDLKMSVYEKDTGAAAVILCDYGVFDGQNFEFTRHCRIKILKKEGGEWANQNEYTVENLILDGKTYNLENGVIVESKLKKESIFSERINRQVNMYRFSLPNVKEGSVIEFRYTKQGLPFNWEFQYDIPVQWSEFRMIESEFVTVQKSFSGYFPLSIVEDNRWIAKDVPAFKSEAFINSSSNYKTKFQLEIRNITIPGKFYKEYASSWESIDDLLIKDETFSKPLWGSFYLKKEVDEINLLNKTQLEKAKEVYELVKREIAWDETNDIYAKEALGSILKSKKLGSSADINLTLVSLLKKLDIKAYPVVLSTRRNGTLTPFFPTHKKLNYVIACAEIEGVYYLLDATDHHAPFGLLPDRCINGEGRLVEEKKGRWIKLSSKKKSKEFIFNNLSLSELGELSGEMIYQFSDYAAYNFRKDLAEYPSHDEYIKDKENSILGLEIQEYEMTDIDSIYNPVKAKYTITLNNKADVIENNIYINPMLYNKLSDNPFKLEKREYPVDFTYPMDETYVLNLTIPEGYVVDQLPASVSYKLTNNKGFANYSIGKNNNVLQLKYQFVINQEVILPVDYGELKQFFDLLIKKHSEMIVLKKKNS
jgi:hypothetical protein